LVTQSREKITGIHEEITGLRAIITGNCEENLGNLATYTGYSVKRCLFFCILNQ
jgi:hypothetical protein